MGEKATPVWPTADLKLSQQEPMAPDEDYANMLTVEQPDSSKVCEWQSRLIRDGTEDLMTTAIGNDRTDAQPRSHWMVVPFVPAADYDYHQAHFEEALNDTRVAYAGVWVLARRSLPSALTFLWIRSATGSKANVARQVLQRRC